MSYKILTVDDSKTIRMIVKKAFKPFDCELVEAENGVEGLSLAAKEKPDLIVLDITMPVMNGIEMLEKMKDETGLKNIPVIMLTAESGKDNVLQIIKMGVKDYMVKPFKGEQLIERVKSMLNLKPKKSEADKTDNKSDKYFSIDKDVQILNLPDQINKTVASEIEGGLQAKIKEMTNAGIDKFILSLDKVKEINMALIKLIISITQNCAGANASLRIVSLPVISESLKEFQEISEIPVNHSLEEAKAAF